MVAVWAHGTVLQGSGHAEHGECLLGQDGERGREGRPQGPKASALSLPTEASQPSTSPGRTAEQVSGAT